MYQNIFQTGFKSTCYVTNSAGNGKVQHTYGIADTEEKSVDIALEKLQKFGSPENLVEIVTVPATSAEMLTKDLTIFPAGEGVTP